MKYWQCVSAGGVPHSYCGINQICCMDPPPARRSSPSSSASASSLTADSSLDPNEADSIIYSTSFNNLYANVPVKMANCGVKGFDSNRDGISDPGEWGWHVSWSFVFSFLFFINCVTYESYQINEQKDFLMKGEKVLRVLTSNDRRERSCIPHAAVPSIK